MEVTAVNKTGLSKVSDSIRIRYNISSTKEGVTNSMTANIVKDDVIVGFYNVTVNGVTGFSLNEGNGMTPEEIKLTFARTIDDSVSVLNK